MLLNASSVGAAAVGDEYSAVDFYQPEPRPALKGAHRLRAVGPADDDSATRTAGNARIWRMLMYRLARPTNRRRANGGRRAAIRLTTVCQRLCQSRRATGRRLG